MEFGILCFYIILKLFFPIIIANPGLVSYVFTSFSNLAMVELLFMGGLVSYVFTSFSNAG